MNVAVESLDEDDRVAADKEIFGVVLVRVCGGRKRASRATSCEVLSLATARSAWAGMRGAVKRLRGRRSESIELGMPVPLVIPPKATLECVITTAAKLVARSDADGRSRR